VKWSYEPPRAEDVPHAIARAIHSASLPPKGPAFVSIPMDDWHAEVDDDAVAHATKRVVTGVAAATAGVVVDLAALLENAQNPVMVAGPDVDASGAWELAVALAEKQKLPVWASPAPGGGRIGFPEGHANFRGVLPPAIGPLGETLAPYDFVLVVGASVFSYYPNIPGPLLAKGTQLVAITSDPDEAQRAPMGDAVVADVRATLEALLDAVGESDREAPEALWPPGDPEQSTPINPSAAVQALADVWPEDGIAVVEAPSATLAVRNRLKLSKPGSWFFGAGGGLGFGLSAAVGVQMAQPDRPVVCVIGEGSVQYAVQAFWSAVAYDVPLTVFVLRNEEYAILKWFAGLENVEGAPGLDLPKLDCTALASAYGVMARRTEGVDDTREALRAAIGSGKPELVEVRVTPGMALF
jgi:benzoylformate decarboxylase